MQTGIAGLPAPQLRDVRWIDGSGEERGPLSLDDLGDGYRILYFFQHWCPGCHAHGFPTLVRLVAELADRNVGFAAIQTVFEGFEVNTFERIRDNQQRYGLNIPFGHVGPERGKSLPVLMEEYRTGGTPWFVVIAPDGGVVLDGFQLHPKALIRVLRPPAA
ncbi:peroxiredoxin family protein [Allosphingosinicella sp.]|uniref:peroxiredoxin family protein n=1 Tax=Allosphingosinicella sp. TaxID=2823234 RepID=UPI002FC2065C